MSTVETSVLAGWNAAMSFDQGKSREHQERAYDYVEAFGEDVDVLCIAELKGQKTGETGVRNIQSRMESLGYVQSIITDGVRPDRLGLSLWGREQYEGGVIELGRSNAKNDRVLPYFDIPGIGRVIGLHNRSDDESERIEIAEGIVDHLTEGTGKPEDAIDAAIIGDFNATYPRDCRNAKLFHASEKVVRIIPRLFEIDYMGSKTQRLAGVAIRACGMTKGGTMDVYKQAGFKDADEDGRPTVFYNMPLVGKLRVDHILATMGLNLSGFRTMPRTLQAGESPVSDHTGIRATVEKSVQEVALPELLAA